MLAGKVIGTVRRQGESTLVNLATEPFLEDNDPFVDVPAVVVHVFEQKGEAKAPVRIELGDTLTVEGDYVFWTPREMLNMDLLGTFSADEGVTWRIRLPRDRLKEAV